MLERTHSTFYITACTTVSGPNTFAKCVFPFTYERITHWGCPVDPDDSSKRWCSTRTDRKGNHIIGQNEYGHCDITCPNHPGDSFYSNQIGKSYSSNNIRSPKSQGS